MLDPGISAHVAHCISFNRPSIKVLRDGIRGGTGWKWFVHTEREADREREIESYERQRGECSRFCNSETRSSVIHDRHSPQFETRLSHARYYAWTSLTGLRWHSIKPRSGLMEFSILSIPLPLIGPMERGLKVFDETLLSIRRIEDTNDWNHCWNRLLRNDILNGLIISIYRFFGKIFDRTTFLYYTLLFFGIIEKSRKYKTEILEIKLKGRYTDGR